MAQHLKLANAGVTRHKIGDWAETETARDIWRSLDMVALSDNVSMTMIAGAPGVGKTEAVEEWCRSQSDRTFMVSAARGEGTPWNFAKSLYFFHPNFNCLAEARDQLALTVGRGSVFIVDEAQYLNQLNRKTGCRGEALEWLRATAELGQFKLVFCGDMNLPNAVATMPQLQSRMMRPVIIPSVGRKDVEAIVSGTPFDQTTAIDALHEVAHLGGGLRNVVSVATRAQMFAGQDAPGAAHIRAAIADMKLAAKGGRS